MKVIYTLDVEDLVAFNLTHIEKIPKVIKTRKRNKRLIPLVYALVGMSWLFLMPQHWLSSAFVLVLSVLWYCFYDKVWEQRKAKQLRKLFKKNNDMRVEAQFNLSIEHEGIMAKTDEKEGFIPNSAISKVVLDNESLYIYTGEEDALIIPKARVQNEVDWESLCQRMLSIG